MWLAPVRRYRRRVTSSSAQGPAPGLLESITGPEDLRRLSYAELDRLAEEIRTFVVDAVAEAGQGHLGSNLGAVELTLAVHRVFDSPKDIVLWDTGHQAYVHKLVTGRREGFSSLRRAGGLSGYPSRAESLHDWVENSHASTILSYAHGMAKAIEVKGLDRRVVAILGDGSLTGGMAFEGLNNLGHAGARCVIVLNDNGRSYAPTASKLSESLSRLRLDPRWLRARGAVERVVQSLPMGDAMARAWEGAEAAVREMWEPPAFFEQLGVRYVGPFDGHDIEGLESALRDAAAYDGPIVVHVLTEKGRGHEPALLDDVKKLHDLGPSIKPNSYTAVFSDALVRLGERDDRVVAITAAMPDSTGLLPFKERFPDRFLDVGIAEQHAVTSAAGMAMLGLRPVFAVYSTFLCRAFDQVEFDVALHGQPVVFCLDRAGITGDDGASHHGVLDMALLTKVPGMTVFAPSSAQELEVMLEEAMRLSDGPSVIRWPKTPAVQAAPGEVGSGLKARCARRGAGDVAILAVGKMLAAALEAAEELDATVWDVRVCKPLDVEMLVDAARHSLVVTVEDGIVVGGVGSQVHEALAALDEARIAPPTLVLGVPAQFIPHAKPDQILAELGLDAAGIVASTQKALAAARSRA